MEEQVTFRLPRAIARALARRARELGVPRSQLVREALAAYLPASTSPAGSGDARRRIAPFLGAVKLDHAAIERDAITRLIRRQNWRP